MSFREDIVLTIGHSNDEFRPAADRSNGPLLDFVGPLLAFVPPLLESVRPRLQFDGPVLAIKRPLLVSAGRHLRSGRPPGYFVVSHACSNGSLLFSNGRLLDSGADTIPAKRPRLHSGRSSACSGALPLRSVGPLPCSNSLHLTIVALLEHSVAALLCSVAGSLCYNATTLCSVAMTLRSGGLHRRSNAMIGRFVASLHRSDGPHACSVRAMLRSVAPHLCFVPRRHHSVTPHASNNSRSVANNRDAMPLIARVGTPYAFPPSDQSQVGLRAGVFHLYLRAAP